MEFDAIDRLNVQIGKLSMFTQSFDRTKAGIRYSLMMGFLLVGVACQPIQAPTQSAADANPPILAEIGGPTVAFVREQTLYIQQGDVAFPVEDCTIGCQVYYLTWSPDGERLAYFYSPATIQDRFEIRLATLTGQVRTVAAGVGWITPPAWSPQGDRLAYLVATERYRVEAEAPEYLLEVWTVEVLDDGMIANARKHGEVGIGGDCGGGGRSESAVLYETEGGLAYGGYLAGILAWTADNLLLYSNNCTAQGVGRFDLTTGVELEPYAGKLRSLSLNRARTGWVAIDEQHQLVLGTPAVLAYEPMVTQAAPELAFYGQVTDDLFYTTLTVTGTADLFDGLSERQQSIPISPYFEFTQPGLHSLRRAASESLLWAGGGYAYARVQQATDGALYFSQVGDSNQLYTALQEGTLTPDRVDDLRPTVDVLRWLPDRQTPERWLASVAQFTLAPRLTE
jgi:hypothetical protein